MRAALHCRQDISEPVAGFRGMSGWLEFVFTVSQFKKKKKDKKTEKFSLIPRI